jgi:hypothetical protein
MTGPRRPSPIIQILSISMSNKNKEMRDDVHLVCRVPSLLGLPRPEISSHPEPGYSPEKDITLLKRPDEFQPEESHVTGNVVA